MYFQILTCFLTFNKDRHYQAHQRINIEVEELRMHSVLWIGLLLYMVHFGEAGRGCQCFVKTSDNGKTLGNQILYLSQIT